MATGTITRVNHDADDLKLSTYAFASGSSIEVSIANYQHGFIILTGLSGNFQSIWTYGASSAGTINVKAIGTAPSQATVTAGTNKITISNSSGAYGYVGVFSF